MKNTILKLSTLLLLITLMLSVVACNGAGGKTDTTLTESVQSTEQTSDKNTDEQTTDAATSETATTQTQTTETQTTEPQTTEPQTTEPVTTQAVTTEVTTEPITEQTETQDNTPLTIEALSQYWLKGQSMRFELGASQATLSKLEVTFSDTSLANKYEIDDDGTLVIPALSAGSLTVTVKSGQKQASCDVKIVSNRKNTVYADDPRIQYIGRTEVNSDGDVVFNNTASGFEVRFFGTRLDVIMYDDKNKDVGAGVAVFVDGETDPTAFNLYLNTDGYEEGGWRVFTLCSFDEPGMHTVKVQKITEESITHAALYSMTVTGELLDVTTKYDVKIQVYGDSITAGYGNMRPGGEADALKPETQNGLMTYVARACSSLNADMHVFAKSGLGLYTNPYGNTRWLKNIYSNVSPDSDTQWDMTSWVPDAVIINIGTNDVWAGNGSAGNTPFAAQDFIDNYVQMVSELAEVWGKDTKFVLCSGMMEKSVNAHLEGVKSALAEQGISAYVVNLPYKSNSDGHPTKSSHSSAAYLLEYWLGVILNE